MRERSLNKYNELKKNMEEMDYELLTDYDDDFKFAKSKITYRCDKGHEKSIIAMNFKRCFHKDCQPRTEFYLNYSREKFNEIKLKVEANNYELLTEFNKNFTKKKSYIMVKCNLGHITEIKASRFRIDTNILCPECNIFKSEHIARFIFEELSGLPFPKIKPDWLIGDKNCKLELDGYNEELKLAFEYQGIYHYNPVHFHCDALDKFERRKYLDQYKMDKCKEQGVVLFAIPYYCKNVEECIEVFLRLNQIPLKKTRKEIDYDNLTLVKTHDKELQEILERKSYKWVEGFPTSTTTPIKVLCDNNHLWETNFYGLKCGYSCYYCHKGGTREEKLELVERECCMCKETKSREHFYIKKNGFLDSYCKTCYSKKRCKRVDCNVCGKNYSYISLLRHKCNTEKKKRPKKILEFQKEKECSRCKEIKEREHFYVKKNGRLISQCKTCCSEQKNKVQLKREPNLIQKKKRCTGCKETKNSEQFYVKKNGYLREKCKDCVLKLGREKIECKRCNKILTRNQISINRHKCI